MNAAPARVLRKKGEQGQALAETALFSVLAVIVIFGILALIPIHRTRTASSKLQGRLSHLRTS